VSGAVKRRDVSRDPTAVTAGLLPVEVAKGVMPVEHCGYMKVVKPKIDKYVERAVGPIAFLLLGFVCTAVACVAAVFAADAVKLNYGIDVALPLGMGAVMAGWVATYLIFGWLLNYRLPHPRSPRSDLNDAYTSLLEINEEWKKQNHD
jgi:hypothetical protein